MRKNNFLKMFVALFILAVISAFSVAAQAGAKQIPVTILVVNALEFLSVSLCCAIIILALFWAFKWWEKHPSYGTLETHFDLFMFNRRKALAQKNAAQIAPALQYLLYIILRRCKAVLGIDPGFDCGSLSPNGRAVTYRNKALYYVLELVMSMPPEQDIGTLKQLLNQFIFAEINNYGIANLPSCFTTSKGKACPSVYLDRLTYDEVRHTLIFELLFVCSDQAAAALERAWERDKPKAATAESEVFDDDV